MYELVVTDDRGNESCVEFDNFTDAMRRFRKVARMESVEEAALYGLNKDGVETRVAHYSYNYH